MDKILHPDELGSFNPIIWSEYFSVLFRILTGQDIVHRQKSSLRVCVVSVVSSTIFIKVNQLKQDSDFGNEYCHVLPGNCPTPIPKRPRHWNTPVKQFSYLYHHNSFKQKKEQSRPLFIFCWYLVLQYMNLISNIFLIFAPASKKDYPWVGESNIFHTP